MTRKLIKFSNYSLCLTIPKSAVKTFGVGKGDIVEVEFDSKRRQIVIDLPKNSKSAPVVKKQDKENSKSDKSLRW